ncbi:HlyD family secretion protein [Roseibium salinum]|uniref:HlyD family secretion protein n=1 Tax=Roseibium salinum TaxID=1604349 RepID=UPI002B053557|nr:HlyD family secretion protein [Roseibium sp. DSM 29163]
MLEIAPLDAFRLTLEVDESQIDEVRPGMKGRFLSTSLPGELFPFEVTKLIPVARPKDGRTVFRVEASIEEDADDLSPGMRGVAKINGGEKSLLWIWTRSFRNWARMIIWTWLR